MTESLDYDEWKNDLELPTLVVEKAPAMIEAKEDKTSAGSCPLEAMRVSGAAASRSYVVDPARLGHALVSMLHRNTGTTPTLLLRSQSQNSTPPTLDRIKIAPLKLIPL